ncbi:ABC transporter substrate-binding protein [Amphibacillus sp. Q70]|uniref:ABC transporter substrate-binding protein n=1 Tax=Amphibacillus sp. Q70 TaxID=3453416 RepID=UPI003F87A922
MFKKRSIILFMVMLLGLILLAGCGGNDAESGGDGGEDTDETLETVNISLWLTPQWRGVIDSSEDGADYDSFFNHAAERFEEEYDKYDVNIDVEVIASDQRDELLNVNLSGGTPPDIFFESTFAMGDYVHRGALAPLTDIVDQESKEDISETYWEQVTFGEDIYFYPFSNNPGTLTYNADMFIDAGLEDYVGGENEIKTWTFDEFETILATLKEDIPTDKYSNAFPMGLFALNDQGDTWNLAYLRMFGNEFFGEDDNIVLDDEDGVRAMEWLQETYQDGLTNRGPESVSSNDVIAMFQNQQLGISVTNSILFNNMLADMESGSSPEFDARIANIPTTDGGAVQFTYVIGSSLFDTGDETRMEVSKDFIEFYSSDPELVKSSTSSIPVRTSVVEEFADENPMFEAYEENAQYLFNFSGNVPGYNELRQVLFPELQAIYTEEKTPAEAVESYQQLGNAVIEQAKEESVIYNQ